MSFKPVLERAFGKGLRAARQNLIPMLVLEGAMALLVAVYYFWPTGAAVLARYAAWQQAGGIAVTAFATGVAGGVISELSLVYFQDGGRWSLHHMKNMGFKFLLFFISGATVYEFYGWQAVWFGQGASWSVLAPKVCADQFGYTVIWAVPYMTMATRWQALNYSGKRLREELDRNFVAEQMLPVLVTNWMFWIPGVCLIYSMPLNLQTPLFIFATAIWGILLPAVGRLSEEQAKGMAQKPVMAIPTALGNPAE
jgi:hypothetical protein